MHSALSSAIDAAPGCVHHHVERLAAAALAAAAHRRRAEIVQPDRDADMGVGRANAVGGVEGDPAEIGHEQLGPGVAGLLLGDAVAAVEMPADVARRDGEAARRRDENVGEVLAHAALERERLGRGGRDMGRIGVEGHFAMQVIEQPMRDLQRVVAHGVARPGEFRDRRIEPGELGLAQEQARRKPLDRAAHHAVGVLGVDLAFDQHAQFGQRPLGGEHVGDVAERILVLVELAVFRHVDAPLSTYWPS